MKGILSLQNAYLSETNTAVKDQLLSDLYIELIKLGKYILQIKKLPNPQEDIYDLASDVCCRLIEKQIPVIRSAPSAYIGSALFFKNKETFHASIDDIDEPTEDSFEDNMFSSDEVGKLQEELIAFCVSITNDPYILQLLKETVLYQMDAKAVKKDLSPEEKTEYSKAIKKVRQYLREKVNGTS